MSITDNQKTYKVVYHRDFTNVWTAWLQEINGRTVAQNLGDLSKVQNASRQMPWAATQLGSLEEARRATRTMLTHLLGHPPDDYTEVFEITGSTPPSHIQE